MASSFNHHFVRSIIDYVSETKNKQLLNDMKEKINNAKERLVNIMDNKNKKVTIAAPWITFAKEVAALFDGDSDVLVESVIENGDLNLSYNYVLNIDVYDHKKFEALKKIMPEFKEFGNVVLGICLFDCENAEKKETDYAQIFGEAFKDNPNFVGMSFHPDVTGTTWKYAVFKGEVVQFFNDDISDYAGNWNGLMEDIARDVFGNVGNIYFCTENMKRP